MYGQVYTPTYIQPEGSLYCLQNRPNNVHFLRTVRQGRLETAYVVIHRRAFVSIHHLHFKKRMNRHPLHVPDNIPDRSQSLLHNSRATGWIDQEWISDLQRLNSHKLDLLVDCGNKVGVGQAHDVHPREARGTDKVYRHITGL